MQLGLPSEVPGGAQTVGGEGGGAGDAGEARGEGRTLSGHPWSLPQPKHWVERQWEGYAAPSHQDWQSEVCEGSHSVRRLHIERLQEEQPGWSQVEEEHQLPHGIRGGRGRGRERGRGGGEGVEEREYCIKYM